MIIQSSKLKVQIWLFYLCLLTAYCLQPAALLAAETWQGVDKSVVEKFAHENGREARKPVIDTDRGDLLLFLFLAAGAAGGFAAGYYWRMLTAEMKSKEKSAGSADQA